MIKQAYNKIRKLVLSPLPKQAGFFDAPELQSDDVMLVSYPRSGNTWVRMIVAHLLYDSNEIKSLADLDYLVPDIYRGIPRHNRYSNPRVIKTHQSFGFRHERKRDDLYSRDIYVVRHPFDVIRSYFDLQLKLWQRKETSIDRFAIKVANGAIGGSWQEHVLSWKTMDRELEILFVRYEDLMTTPVEEIGRIADFLGKSINRAEAEEINYKSSLENMQGLEKKKSLVDEKYQFVRREQDKRQLKNDMSPETKKNVFESCQVGMRLFGYNMEQ